MPIIVCSGFFLAVASRRPSVKQARRKTVEYNLGRTAAASRAGFARRCACCCRGSRRRRGPWRGALGRQAQQLRNHAVAEQGQRHVRSQHRNDRQAPLDPRPWLPWRMYAARNAPGRCPGPLPPKPRSGSHRKHRWHSSPDNFRLRSRLTPLTRGSLHDLLNAYKSMSLLPLAFVWCRVDLPWHDLLTEHSRDRPALPSRPNCRVRCRGSRCCPPQSLIHRMPRSEWSQSPRPLCALGSSHQS